MTTPNPQTTSSSAISGRRRITLTIHRDCVSAMRDAFPLRELGDPHEYAIQNFREARFGVSDHGPMTLTVKQWREACSVLRSRCEAEDKKIANRAINTYAQIRRMLEQKLGSDITSQSTRLVA